MSDKLDVSEIDDIVSFVHATACKSDLTTYEGNRMLQVLASVEQKEEAMGMLFHQMKILSKVNVYTYNIYISFLARTSRTDEILSLMQEMREKKITPDNFTFNSLINGYSRAGKHSKAALVLKKMKRKGLTPDQVSFATQISLLCKEQRPTKALRLLRRMQQDYDIEPDPTLFNNVINAFCKSAMIDKAKGLFLAMMDSNIKPDAITFTTLIYALNNAKKYEEATALLEKMKEYDIQPDLVTIDTVMDGFYANNQPEKALELYREMKIKYNVEPGYLMFSKVIKEAASTGDKTLVCALLDDMKASKRDPKESVSSVVSYLAKKGETETVWNLWQLLQEQSVIPSLAAFNSLVYSLYKNNEPTKAASVLASMKELGVGPDITTVNIMFHHNLPDLQEAIKILMRMGEHNIVPNEYTYGTIINSLCTSKRHDEAIEWLETLQKDFDIVPTVLMLTTILTTVCKAGELDKARDMYAQMKKFSYIPTTATYNILINAFAKKECFDFVTDVLHDMEEAGVQLDIVTYCTLISSYCLAGDKTKALFYMDLMKKRNIQGNDVFEEIVRNHKLRTPIINKNRRYKPIKRLP